MIKQFDDLEFQTKILEDPFYRDLINRYRELSKHRMCDIKKALSSIYEHKFRIRNKPKYGEMSKRLPNEYFDLLLENTKNEKLKLSFIIQRNLGLRVSEVVLLNLSDITPKGELVIHNIKVKTLNVLQIPNEVRELLIIYIKKHYNKILKHKGFIFYSSDNKDYHLSKAYIRNKFREISLKAGFNKVYSKSVETKINPITKKPIKPRNLYLYSTHSLRYSFISSFYEETKDIELTKIVARHSEIKTTQTYIKIDKGRVNEVLKNLSYI